MTETKEKNILVLVGIHTDKHFTEEQLTKMLKKNGYNPVIKNGKAHLTVKEYEKFNKLK